MRTSELKPPDELRSDVRRALETKWFDSFKVSLAFAGAMVAVCGVFGGGLIARSRFTDAWFVILAMVPIVSGIVAFAVLEFFRLSARSDLLRQLIESEKYYDSLLNAAWVERDRAVTTARQLQTRLDVLMSLRELVRPANADAETKALPAAEASGNENE